MSAKLHIDQAKIAAAFKELEEARAVCRSLGRRKAKLDSAVIAAEWRLGDAERAWKDLPNTFVKK